MYVRACDHFKDHGINCVRCEHVFLEQELSGLRASFPDPKEEQKIQEKSQKPKESPMIENQSYPMNGSVAAYSYAQPPMMMS